MTPLRVLFALAVGALLLGGGSVAHVHALDQPGLYNQEHDLGYLAAHSSAGPVPAALVPLGFEVVRHVRVIRTVGPLATAPPRHANLRAPPTR